MKERNAFSTLEEHSLFVNRIRFSKSILEFGAGQSTLAALRNSSAFIYSIESNKEYMDSLNQIIPDKYKDRCFFRHADIGPVDRYGGPLTLRETSCDTYTDLSFISHVDCCVIDGRFRVACFFKCIMMFPCIGLIFMHDFWMRERYSVVLQFSDVIATADQLVALRPKTVNPEDMKHMYENYKLDVS